MKPRVIALHGLPQSGKDTVADALAAIGFVHLKFATALYAEVAENFGVTVEQLKSERWKTRAQAELATSLSKDEAYRDGTTEARTSRYQLRRWAHEYRRSQDHTYWIKKFDEVYRSHLPNRAAVVNTNLPDPSFVISDLRYLDEYSYLSLAAFAMHANFQVIEIVRRGGISPEGGHISDRRLAPDLISHIIQNIEGEPEIAINHVFQYLGIPATARSKK